jgi:hypothetical protein
MGFLICEPDYPLCLHKPLSEVVHRPYLASITNYHYSRAKDFGLFLGFILTEKRIGFITGWVVLSQRSQPALRRGNFPT